MEKELIEMVNKRESKEVLKGRIDKNVAELKKIISKKESEKK